MLVNVVIICLGFAGLIWGADKFVFGASAFARNVGIPPLVIGLTIVAFGTSAPEIFSSAASALAGEPELAIGNAIGSNIFNLGIALGVALVIKPITPPKSLARKELPALMLVSVLCGVLMMNLYIGAWDALMLIAVVTFFIVYLFTSKRAQPADADADAEDDDEIPNNVSTGKALTWLILGLVLLIVSAEYLVDASISIAQILGVSSGIIGLTLVALGTSLPELAATVTCALRGHHELAVGNIIGSNVLNILVVLPFPGLLAASYFDSSLFYRDYMAMMALTILLLAISYPAIRARRQLGRSSGIAFIMLYLAWFGIMYYQIH